ncbi:MAG: hypothetical protein OXN17_00170 [Candidatus Poribacteria bacterium]|nr:hypothetical protein [Candidatus Poribacteria bacterium]MDE0506296.1 hypothetical protein [Candidatus Poribacteria bacterium]
MHMMLRDLRRTFQHIVLVLFVIAFASCTSGGVQAPLSWHVKFVSRGVEVHFDASNRRSIRQVRVLSAIGADEIVVAQLHLDSQPRTIETLYFRWENGIEYRFEVQGESGDTLSKTLRAPQSDQHGSLEIAIPYGTIVRGGLEESDSPASLSGESLVLEDSDMTMTLLVRNDLRAPVDFEVKVEIPFPLRVSEFPADLDIKKKVVKFSSSPSGSGGENSHLTASGRFAVESEVWYRQVGLYVPTEPLSDSTRISGRVFFKSVDGVSWERQVSVPLRSATINEIASLISIEDVFMPTDEVGIFDPRQRPDVISNPQPVLGRLGKWLGVRAEHTDYFEPISYQSVLLRNAGEQTIHLLVSGVNLDARNGNPVPSLAPPAEFNAGTNRTFAFASLEAQTTTNVPLPIYFNPSMAEDTASRGFKGRGRYAREIEVKVWGSDKTIIHATRPLYIETPNQQALVVTVCAFGGAIVGFILFFGYHRAIFKRFSTKQLIVIALFGATIFVAVSIPSTLIANLISALLGPASFLVTGLINEMLYYALLTALLMLVPKTGVITLVSLVRLLLGGVVLGLFNPTTVVFTGVSALLLELGFRISGNGHRLLPLALAFGVCDSAAVFVDFQISMTLYRLFYADWYIISRCVIDGFIYTFVGVFLGRRLGWGLWRVAE